VYSPHGTVTVLYPLFTPDGNNASDFSNTTLYAGREFDVGTGLVYYRARYYHAQLAVYLLSPVAIARASGKDGTTARHALQPPTGAPRGFRG
jgi:RHS repeat-associated protein